MIKKIKSNKQIIIIILIVLAFILWSERKILAISTGMGNRILEFFYTVCMLISLSATIYYLLLECDSNLSVKKIKFYYIFLLGVQIVAFLPLYTQNFMYGDDLWGFATNFDGQLSSGLYFSRPFINFLLGPLQDTSFLFIKSFRLYNGLILFLFGCILFRFLIANRTEEHIAFLISLFAIGTCFAVDCVAYASIYPINMSLLLSAVSFVFYIKSRESKVHKKSFIMVSMVSLLTAFCMYQLGTTVVFLFYLIAEVAEEKTKEKKRFINIFKYLLFYGFVTIVYLLTNKILSIITGISAGQNARSELNLSISYFYFKLKWFLSEVIPQSFSRTIGAVFGNSLFKENNMFYNCTYVHEILGILLVTFLAILALIFIVVTAYRKKSIVFFLICLAAIPLSFWPFLVLPESYFLTYYAIGIILLFAWLIIGGMSIVAQELFYKIRVSNHFFMSLKKLSLSILTVIIVLQSNNYAENSWVNYCRDSYEYLANSITANINNNNKIDTIYVQGSISPYVGGRDYVVFCVENILNEIGKEPENFKILQSDNGNYVLTFNDDEVPYMKQVLGQDTMNELLNYYTHDDMYSRWCYEGTANDEESINFLKDCFIQTRQLTQIGENVCVVSMDGFNIRNSF